MKNLTRILVIILVVTMVGFNSCVKTEVSPEVTALRQTQVDKLKADIATILANNSYRWVQTRQLKMQTTFDSLNRAFLQKQTDAQFQVTLANIASSLELNKGYLAQYQLATAQAVAAYNKFVAEGNFDANVSQYLNSYTNATNDLNALYITRLNKVHDIAVAQLMLNAGTGPLTWDAVKTQLQVQLTDKTAALTAARAALTSLQGVLDNPTTVDATKTALAIQIKDLADQNAALDVQVQQATNALTDANTLVTNATTVIASMATLNTSITTKNAAIVTQNATIATATADVTTKTNAIAAPTAALALANSTLASATSNLASAQSASDAKLVLYNTANAAWSAANDDVTAKTVARDIALNNLNADPSNTALQTIYNNSVTALATANTTLTAATTAKSNAQTALTAANATLTTATTTNNNAKSAATTAQTTLTTAQTALTTSQATLTTANNTLATLNTDLNILVANKANIQTAYDSAVANLSTLQIAANTANNAKIKVVADEAANTAMQTSLTSVLNLLTTELTNLLAAINTQKTTVSTLESDVATLNQAISQNAIDKTAAQDQLTAYQAQLAVIDVQITEKIAAVAKWKSLLDSALAGKI